MMTELSKSTVIVMILRDYFITSFVLFSLNERYDIQVGCAPAMMDKDALFCFEGRLITGDNQTNPGFFRHDLEFSSGMYIVHLPEALRNHDSPGLVDGNSHG